MVTQIQLIGVMPAILVTPLLLIICAGLIRSTPDHHPVNPGTVALVNDPLVNELALSSTYTTFDGQLTAEDLVDPELAKRTLAHSARSSMRSD